MGRQLIILFSAFVILLSACKKDTLEIIDIPPPNNPVVDSCLNYNIEINIDSLISVYDTIGPFPIDPTFLTLCVCDTVSFTAVNNVIYNYEVYSWDIFSDSMHITSFYNNTSPEITINSFVLLSFIDTFAADTIFPVFFDTGFYQVLFEDC